MDFGVISVRYARALLKSALDQKLEDQVYHEMQTMAQSYIDVPALRQTIDNPMLSKDVKQILLTTAAGPLASQLTQSFIALVLKEDRENMIQFMANSYVTLYRKQKNVKTQGTVEFETEVNPDIIGGFILEYDTYRMDASVKSKLNNILNTLKR